ncbi:MAG: peptide chain release factor 1 [Candidatus Lambdaproteobacteria bacterium RIFOXYD1_FULL_56_27]|uniref:Peptide chain release factor 1 n=1 Tax=Candidatus Lambdaproteobacteria bacterium RIFOXYD2_FULL_56_26 TaxID=1817773 RepID=A0A1F6GZ90_9PROT|nr:MAG: peptide chain release factor 1 [Candidatus Lambdaproteobacteria bacterium RIFOXYC1_FULL_56_13]OGH03340.1 MAG: peptide chain release factor 1 [Candidatus Lambdaproteobacteria bacterium RIFOXYD2_FULL_56_26]OGH06655.1 MAG: peptide chain release factor 1 [Candidatus Lambdaproteobacteria bacterium RIFOXYD1_FULL_56_27]
MFDKLARIADRFEEVTALLGHPDTLSNSKRLREVSQEQAKLKPIYDLFVELKKATEELEGNQAIIEDPAEDPQMKEMARAELGELKKRVAQLEQESQLALLPKDPDDGKNVILEIRAGTGGDEAGIFAGDLFRMYQRYAEQKRWTLEVLESSPAVHGGFKEITASIEGAFVFANMKFEAGTHRVQRVPATEAQGRIHTSACTVAILPEADEVEVNINPADLKIDTYRSSGAGGQHVNKTESAIRITHVPTGIVVACQEERSQIKNRAKAMKYLQAKIYDQQAQAQASELAVLRKNMVGSGDRSERIRTYNYPQGRITDHRIGLTLYRLEEVMNTGSIQEIVNALAADQQAELLKADLG